MVNCILLIFKPILKNGVGMPLFIWGKLRLMRPFLQNLRSHSNETAAQVPEA